MDTSKMRDAKHIFPYLEIGDFIYIDSQNAGTIVSFKHCPYQKDIFNENCKHCKGQVKLEDNRAHQCFGYSETKTSIQNHIPRIRLSDDLFEL